MSSFLTDAGGRLSRLTGSANYSRWARDFQLLAQSKSSWYYFITEDLKTGYRGIGFGTDGLPINLFHPGGKRHAFQLLLFAVDPALRGELEQFSYPISDVAAHMCYPLETADPYAAWGYLRNKYRIDDVVALELAKTKMDGLYQPDFDNMAEYLKQFRYLDQDIIDAGGRMQESEMVKKIVAGLGLDYGSFANANITTTDPLELDLQSLTAGLLLFEAALHKADRERRKLEALKKAMSCGKEDYESDATKDGPELLNKGQEA